ncbi:peroxisomal biogenesis factor pex11 [Cyclospora cayetanensis]|uniref:Peroxisomal biogenesis factor pex11 n=1 Tax=Cyclospora cayetanensis TaxID=88456 RepID=A0A1D3CSD1_9EIME|nr:peroxisomal biogenesis factor pex11 [Cyclospora cayetanensis]
MNLQLTHLHSSRLAEADKIVAFLNKTGAVFVAVFAAGPASVVGLSKVVTAYSLTHWQCPFWFGCWVWQPVRAALYVAAAAPPSCMLRASEFLEKAVAIAGVAFSAAFSAEGRDKVTKALQYGCRFLAWAVSNSKAASKFTAVYRASADSRKVFRLGKFINEYAALLRLAAAKTPEADIDKKIHGICRAAFLCYWLADNAFILTKLKVMNHSQQKLTRLSGFCWLVALLAGVWCEVLRLRHEAAVAAERLKKEGEVEDLKETTAAQLQQQQAHKTARLNLIKQCCDMPAAINMTGLPAVLFHRNLTTPFCEPSEGQQQLDGAAFAVPALCSLAEGFQ